MTDILSYLAAVHREVGSRPLPAGEGRTVVLRRSYDAPIEDVWDALTDPDRINRWFLPVTGDFRLGGRYQLQGNAGGEILRCEPPRLLKVTWVFAENPSDADITEVEVRLAAADNGQTTFELEHAAYVDPKMLGEFGPGAVGVGWDLVLLGLGLYLSNGTSVENPEVWQTTPEAREFMIQSSQAWGAAHEAAGADSAEAATAAANTAKFYAPDPTSDNGGSTNS
ncbi:SRPBCC family protein [Actinopolymorpha alba]|uniref:SRPBCC family protein n=1 Tax=Actinopolymorpha alba TaxID=533267 RepID=UPI00036125FC|nr:SRPBCC family protein [Actinopolymorpha alba]